MEELSGRLVVIVANLKTAKLAGETSEGMILAAVSKGSQYENGELVYPLSAPGKLLMVCTSPKRMSEDCDPGSNLTSQHYLFAQEGWRRE